MNVVICVSGENRNDFGTYETRGEAGRGTSFENDFHIFNHIKMIVNIM